LGLLACGGAGVQLEGKGGIGGKGVRVVVGKDG